ncbi:Predicted 5' DNA nuclease, flap endonuclease-1-like, helix-3-turn-helix (H3TH) domain [Rhodovulum sp. ES.010]|nr:Predicted 5' DNA nuclease, flap endonuclease-1-like, helix-3-turn-helix (H3TH) domain [Rhodovulum sp. ES.010]
MNISRSEAKFKCAIFWWLLAAVIGLTAMAFLDWLGLWALVSFAGGAGTGLVAGAFLTASFCQTDEEHAEKGAEMRAIQERRAAYKVANDAIEIPKRPKPGGGVKAAPTVPKSGAKPAPAPKPAAAPKPAPAASAPADVGKRPAALAAPRAAGADDLKKLKGVGPKLERQLNELGIYHFAQIAEWGDDEVAWMDEHLEGFKGRVSRDGWVGQADTLAKGGEVE